jgi:hypothetical protein
MIEHQWSRQEDSRREGSPFSSYWSWSRHRIPDRDARNTCQDASEFVRGLSSMLTVEWFPYWHANMNAR